MRTKNRFIALVGYLNIIAATAAVLCLLAAVAVVRRRRIYVDPIVILRAGAFEQLVKARALQSAQAQVQVRNVALCAPIEAGRSVPVEAHRGMQAAAAEWSAAVADGVVPALGVWAQWESVDHHVFQAFSHLAGEQIDGMADLLRVVDTKEYAIQSAGLLNKLLGHVGEWHARDHLASAGFSVSMPEATNAPGLDLWADGNAVNVKTVKDAAAAAYQHFGDYPDIPIIVPADAANIPSDALHFDPSSGFDSAALAGGDHLVVVDHALSHADVLDQSQNALDVLGDPGPHLHFPWITAALSGVREARLLVKGHTDLARAAKNVAVDTAAVGGGGAVGMKVGALVGAALGPVGAVVGGIAGGLLGAIGGRSAANTVKRAPFEAARTEYEVALATYHATEAKLVAEAGATWERAQQEEGGALNTELRRLQGEFDSVLAEQARRLHRTAILEKNQAQELLLKAGTTLASVCDGNRVALHALLPRWLWPWAGLLVPAHAQRLVQHGREHTRWQREVERVMRVWTGSASDTSACFDLLMATAGGEAAAEAHLAKAALARQRVVSAAGQHHQRLLAQATQSRAVTVERLRQRWQKISAHVSLSLEEVVTTLRAKGADLHREMQKNGMTG
ncbi:MAG TPA: hypothetical protein VFQ61_09060 [Polyangiaceae bacterium]|nr:hypothetical protein [Polyangiaceae bacterium]